MFDFRYHALSLVAVFLALTVGLLLGVAIGDAELVSSAKEDIEESLRGEVRDAQQEADDLRGELREHQRFEEEAYRPLVAGRLEGLRVGLIALGGLSDRTARRVGDALDGTGARLASVSVVRKPLDLAGLAERADGSRYEQLPEDDDLVEPLGIRVGTQYVQGGRLLRRLRGALLRSYSGSFEGLDAIVLVRAPGDLSPEDGARAGRFERGLVRGVRALDVPVVGIEETTARPSQIGWYKDRDVASVDNVDQVAGRAALVFVLAGADGHFGVKATADALLPNAVGPAGSS